MDELFLMEIVADAIGEFLEKKTLLLAYFFSRKYFKHTEDFFEMLKWQKFAHRSVASNGDDI
jgi:hypothetical protein